MQENLDFDIGRCDPLPASHFQNPKMGQVTGRTELGKCFTMCTAAAFVV
jgi:hypothetical protein